MEDGEEPMDTSGPSLEETEKFEDVDSLPQLEMELKLYIPVLKRMLLQAKNLMEQKAIKDVLSVALALEDGSQLISSEKLTFCEKQFKKWIFDSPPTPPEVKNVEFKKMNGKLIATWSAPEWPLSISYCGQCAQSSGKREVVDQFKGVRETSYELSNVSPIQLFVLTVWAVNSKGQKGEEKRSKRDILCKSLDPNIFVDTTSPLRIGYRVYKGYLKTVSPDLDPVAVKMVYGENLREVRALQRVKHRNVVTYRASGKISELHNVEKQIFFAMELCGTDTFQELVKGKKLDMHCCKISLRHMMLGLAAIHEAGFLHRDLKPQNIFRSLDGEDMKVAAFGMCKEMDPNKSNVSISAFEVGTEGWGSPEHYRGKEMSIKSDIYSAGLVSAFGLSQGKHVYGSDSYYWKPRIKAGLWADLSILACDDVQSAKDMISKMLQEDPDKRPTAKEVLAHPFFWNEKRKLNFLSMMAKFFAQFIYVKKENRKTPEGIVAVIINELKSNGEIIKAEGGEKNWIEMMKNYKGDKNRLAFVLGEATGKRVEYEPSCVFYLLRFIRNSDEHFPEGNLKTVFKNRRNVWKFFSELFPQLFCTVYNATSSRWSQLKSYQDFPQEADDLLTSPPLYQPMVSDRKNLEQ